MAGRGYGHFPMSSAYRTTSRRPWQRYLQFLPRRLLAPLPLFPWQPLLARAVNEALRSRPQLFSRVAGAGRRRFLIDPVNLPFALLLELDTGGPRLLAVSRRRAPPHDARIAGTLLTLLAMVDGRLDGDALFFSRDLVIEGDTEAVVALRNALDDLDGSVVDEATRGFGAPARAMLAALRAMPRPS